MSRAVSAPKRMSPSDRRRQLTGIALEVIAESEGGELSLEAVADRADVTRNLLYHYFPRGKQDLELAAVKEAAAQLTGSFDTDPTLPLDEKAQRNLSGFVVHAWDRTDAWQAYINLRSRSDAEILARIDAYRDSIVEAIALNHFGTPAPGAHAHAALRGFLEFGAEALNQGRDAGLEIEDVVKLLADVLYATVESVRPTVAAADG